MPAPTVLPVRQRTDEWLEARKNGIGASEAAAAIGLSPWQSPIGLWAEKLGLVPATAQNTAMRIGTELEPLIASLYTEATGVKVRRANNLRQHSEHPFMLASIDRRAGRKPVELKFSARATGYGEPGTDEVPDDVLVQVLHQLAVLDEPEGDVALLRPGREGVSIYPITRNADAEAAIVEREAVFYDHVLSRREPPVDGSDATRETLNALYRGDPDLVLEADLAVARDMQSLRAFRSTIDALEIDRATVEARIKAAMLEAGASLVRAEGVGEIPWRATKPRETTDWKRVAGIFRESLDEIVALMETGEAWPLPLEAVVRSTGTIVDLNTETKESAPRFGPPKWTEEE